MVGEELGREVRVRVEVRATAGGDRGTEGVRQFGDRDNFQDWGDVDGHQVERNR